MLTEDSTRAAEVLVSEPLIPELIIGIIGAYKRIDDLTVRTRTFADRILGATPTAVGIGMIENSKDETEIISDNARRFLQDVHEQLDRLGDQIDRLDRIG